MDRQLLRKLARTEYKKLMKSTPKAKRMTFAQAFPMLKTMLANHLVGGSDEAQATELLADDADLIQGMMEEEHVHGPDCNHDA